MRKIILVRVPRTASTNFSDILRFIYKNKVIRDYMWRELPKKVRIKRLKEGGYFYDLDNFKYPEKDMRKYDVIEGHFLLEKYKEFRDEYEFITFLRDPVERCISHYNFNVSRNNRLGIDIRRFAEIYKNIYKKMIGNDLSVYNFIGITEKFDFSVNHFYEKLKIPEKLKHNLKGRGHYIKGRRKHGNTKKNREYIRKLNKEDYKIYNMAKYNLES